MIESFALPEFASGAACPIDLPRAATFPALNYVAEFLAFDWFHEGMEVIGHDDPGVELIVGSVTFCEFTNHRLRTSRIRQKTFSMPGIQQFVKPRRKFTMIGVALLLGELVELLC